MKLTHSLSSRTGATVWAVRQGGEGRPGRVLEDPGDEIGDAHAIPTSPASYVGQKPAPWRYIRCLRGPCTQMYRPHPHVPPRPPGVPQPRAGQFAYLPGARLRAGVRDPVAAVESMDNELLRLEGDDETLEGHASLRLRRRHHSALSVKSPSSSSSTVSSFSVRERSSERVKMESRKSLVSLALKSLPSP